MDVDTWREQDAVTVQDYDSMDAEGRAIQETESNPVSQQSCAAIRSSGFEQNSYHKVRYALIKKPGKKPGISKRI